LCVMVEPFFATIAVSFATLTFMKAKAEVNITKSIQRPKIDESDGWGPGGSESLIPGGRLTRPFFNNY
jgi:hypothetical protein